MSQLSSTRRGWYRRHPIKIGCLVFVLVAAIALGACIRRDSQRGWTKARLEDLIVAEVPGACDRTHVEAWFDKHGIEHLYFADTTGDQAGKNTMPMLAGLRDEDLSGMVRGRIDGPEANVGFGESGRISVYFFFDKQGKMVGHLVYVFVYSL